MTLEQAREHIGHRVTYRYHGPHGPLWDEGVITGVNARFVFVRYGSDTGSKATDAERLDLLPDYSSKEG